MENFNPDAFIASQQGVTPPPKSTPNQGQGFDPDAFIKSNGQSAGQSESGFDPDAFLAQGQDEHYGTPGQQAIAGIEGAAQGVAGPFATLAETKVLGVPAEDIAGREHANPWTHRGGEAVGLIGGLVSGAGELAGIARGAEVVANAAKLGKFGSMALKGGLEMAALHGSEEANHYLTGYDPSQTVSSALANMGYAGIMGAVTGGLFSLGEITSSAGLKALEDSKLMNRASEFLQGAGAKAAETGIHDTAANEILHEEASPIFKSGYKFAEKLPNAIPDFLINKVVDNTADFVGGGVGGALGSTFGMPGAASGAVLGAKLTHAYIDPIINKILKKPLTSFSKKYVMPPVIKALTNENIQALPAAIQMGLKSAKGAKMINSAFDSVFIPGLSGAFSATVDPQIKARINQNIEDEVMDQQAKQPDSPSFAQGGEVQKPSTFADTFQAEAALLQSAKARVYNHLKTLRPSKKPGLIYDKNEPTKAQEKTYDKALDLAANPLHIFHHIKQGNLTSEHLIHMNQMWPELTHHLRAEASRRIMESAESGKKPPYKIRQNLALLMGTALDTAMTPQGILAAQTAFQGTQQNQQPQKGTKSSPALQKASQIYKTPNEAGEADQAVRK